ncbi:MAG: cysteine synthase A [Erysipelotrichaceae bacterium]|nr:cysteine synthase A [Erysipelotrichaceae bacterium]
MRIYESRDQLVGHTPLLKLNQIKKELNLKGNVLVKLEMMNPAGSIKDRAALHMLNMAENKGLVHEGTVVIEPTSGNTGIGLASACAVRGYRCVILMPDTMSVERQLLMQAYGAEVVLTDGKLGMNGAIAKAEELAKEYPDSWIAGQFINPDNAEAHILTTGPEIWEDTDGKVDVFVAGAGTGGTITGTAKYLKAKNKDIEIVAVEPEKSPVLSKGTAGAHGLQGIGAGFVPEILDVSVLDRIMPVTEEKAYETARLLGKKEGILCGISGGAALYAALHMASLSEYEDKMIVVVLPDGAERYLSTNLYRPD